MTRGAAFLPRWRPLPPVPPAPPRLVLPLHRVLDGRLRPNDPGRKSWPPLWSEAARDFRQGGIDFDLTDGAGEVAPVAGGKSHLYFGLQRLAPINVVATDVIPVPINWDGGRALAGVRHDSRGVSHLPDCIALRAWESSSLRVGQYLPARDSARSAAGCLPQTAQVVSGRRPRSPRRLLCHAALAVPRRRGSPQGRRGVPYGGSSAPKRRVFLQKTPTIPATVPLRGPRKRPFRECEGST